jgi:esterase/lipase
MKKLLIILLSASLLIYLTYVLGPAPQFENVDPEIIPVNISLERLDDWVAEKEAVIPKLKPDNEARVIWADSIRKTEWAIVYLHGFSASPREGYPVHQTIARKFGMNLYLARISGHGIDDPDSFLELTPSDMINSAKEAIAIGQLLGEKVLVMSCSTGGTYAIYLAAHQPELVDALVLYSPNIEIYDPNAKLLSGPWGRELGQLLLGDYRTIEQNIGTVKEQFTTSIYRLEGLIALQALLDQTMQSNFFEQIAQPVFLGYYYKNEEEQDKVVSVKAMQAFAEMISTPSADIRHVPFPESGNHVICSDLHSSDYQSVIDETSSYIEEVLNVSPVIAVDSLQMD